MFVMYLPGLCPYTFETFSEKVLGTNVSSQRASLSSVGKKNLPAVWETWIQFLGWEDPLEKGKATHSSIVAWRIPWTVNMKRSD